MKNNNKTNNPALENNAFDHILEEYQKRGLEKIPKFNLEANNIFQNSLLLEEGKVKIRNYVNSTIKTPNKLNKEIRILQKYQFNIAHKKKGRINNDDNKINSFEKKNNTFFMNSKKEEDLNRDILKKTKKEIINIIAKNKKENRRLKSNIEQDSQEFKVIRDILENEKEKEDIENNKNILILNSISTKKCNQTAQTAQTIQTNQTKDNTRTTFFSSPKNITKQFNNTTINKTTPITTITDFQANYTENCGINPIITKNSENLTMENNPIITSHDKYKKLTTSTKKSKESENTQNQSLNSFNHTNKEKLNHKSNIINIQKNNLVPVKLMEKKLKKNKRIGHTWNQETNLIEEKTNLSNYLDLGNAISDIRRDEIHKLYHKYEKNEHEDETEGILNYCIDYLEMDKTQVYEDFKKPGK